MNDTSSEKIKIKRADSREFVEGLVNLFDEDYGTPFSVYTPDLLGYAKKIFSYGEVYYATFDETPIGMCSFYANDTSEAKTAYLSSFVVSRKTRRLGVGNALLSVFFEVSISRGMKFAKLQVYEADQGAISLYMKRGFQRERNVDGKSFYMVKLL